MTRLIVHVEGKTEETFVNELLAPHLYKYGFSKVTARGMGGGRQREKRQGVKPWTDIKKAICNILLEDRQSYASLLVDYYGMPPSTWPGRSDADRLQHDLKSTHIQDLLRLDVETDNPNISRRFIPYILMHEFEALLFSDCAGFAQGIYEPHLEQSLSVIRSQFASPEHINDSPLTAPSKRILKLMPKYQKPINGTLAALEIGLATMRSECHGFNQWITQLEAIGSAAS